MPSLRDALTLAKEGRREDALNIAIEVIREQPTNADAWVLIAQLVDDPDRALESWRRAAALRPTDVRIRREVDILEAQLAESFFLDERPKSDIPAATAVPESSSSAVSTYNAPWGLALIFSSILLLWAFEAGSLIPIVIIIVSSLCAGAAGRMMYDKGRSGDEGFWLGYVLGIIGVIIVAIIPADPARSLERRETQILATGRFKKCSYCQEIIDSRAVICPRCQREQPVLQKAVVLPAPPVAQPTPTRIKAPAKDVKPKREPSGCLIWMLIGIAIVLLLLMVGLYIAIAQPMWANPITAEIYDRLALSKIGRITDGVDELLSILPSEGEVRAGLFLPSGSTVTVANEVRIASMELLALKVPNSRDEVRPVVHLTAEKCSDLTAESGKYDKEPNSETLRALLNKLTMCTDNVRLAIQAIQQARSQP